MQVLQQTPEVNLSVPSLYFLLHLLLFSCTTLATSIYNIFYFTLFNPIPDVVISSPTPCNNIFFLDYFPWPSPTFFHYFPQPIQVYSHFLSFFSLFISSLQVFLKWGSDVPLLGLPWLFLSFFLVSILLVIFGEAKLPIHEYAHLRRKTLHMNRVIDSVQQGSCKLLSWEINLPRHT